MCEIFIPKFILIINSGCCVIALNAVNLCPSPPRLVCASAVPVCCTWICFNLISKQMKYTLSPSPSLWSRFAPFLTLIPLRSVPVRHTLPSNEQKQSNVLSAVHTRYTHTNYETPAACGCSVELLFILHLIPLPTIHPNTCILTKYAR